jgi:gluconate 2-dehydrogenase alpha chain
VADWPLDYAALEPYYADVEAAIGVAGTAGANPFAEWRSGPYPMPSGAPMYGATLSAAAAERLGYHPYPAPTAANSVPYDGRPACNNCGFCAFSGCPIHAKGDPVALLTTVMASGNAELWPETFVTRIRTDGRRATGVDYIGPDGVEHAMDAAHVIVAGGAVETPRLLLLSGLEHPLLGRYLMVHYQTLVAGAFPFALHGHKGRAVTHLHDDFIVGDDEVRAAAAEAGLPWLRGGLVEHGGASFVTVEAKHSPWGRRHAEAMRSSALRNRLWGMIMQGEDLAYPTNAVDLDPTVRDARGLPVARVTYRGGRHELAASAHFGPRMDAILTEMGAEWTASTTSPGIRYQGRGFTAVPDSRHVMGTTRMGADPATSVVDPYGRVHGLDNVVVCDSSVFVTAAGYGPTLTLCALSARAAAHLAGTEH